jgi:hypothetical protein
MSRRARPTEALDIEKRQPEIADEIRRLQKIQALLLAVQFAANHEAEFDVADALAAIAALVDESLSGLDRLEAAR